MRMLIILTMLISGYAYSFSSTREYAAFVEDTANRKLVASRLDCSQDIGRVYSCRLHHVGDSVDRHNLEYLWLVGHVRRMNKDVEGGNVVGLNVMRGGYVR